MELGMRLVESSAKLKTQDGDHHFHRLRRGEAIFVRRKRVARERRFGSAGDRVCACDNGVNPMTVRNNPALKSDCDIIRMYFLRSPRCNRGYSPHGRWYVTFVTAQINEAPSLDREVFQI